MIATLPMYDFAEAAAHTDRLWRAIADRLRDAGVAAAPRTLSREGGTDALLAPDLLLGQTCGYPLTHALAGRLRYVATPCYRAPGCAGSFYRSAFVVRADDPAHRLADCRGAVFALNGTDSQSGWNAPRLAVARVARGQSFFGALLETGAHHASLQAVSHGRADVCAVDCVSLALLARHRPRALDGLRLLTWTEPAPGLPFVTRAEATDAELRRLRTALAGALRDDALAYTRDALLITGVEVLGDHAYRRILDMEAMAARLGFVPPR